MNPKIDKKKEQENATVAFLCFCFILSNMLFDRYLFKHPTQLLTPTTSVASYATQQTHMLRKVDELVCLKWKLMMEPSITKPKVSFAAFGILYFAFYDRVCLHLMTWQDDPLKLARKFSVWIAFINLKHDNQPLWMVSNLIDENIFILHSLIKDHAYF